MKHFDEDGLSFDWPDDWALQREDGPEGWAVTLQSPGSAFAVVRLYREMPPIEEMATTALAALREDYPALEASPVIETLAGEMAVGHDIEFFRFDLPISCSTRAFYGPAGSVFVLCQVADVEQEEYEPALSAFRASMRAEVE